MFIKPVYQPFYNSNTGTYSEKFINCRVKQIININKHNKLSY